jgi:DNA-binding GntR family transcriptional regulator
VLPVLPVLPIIGEFHTSLSGNSVKRSRLSQELADHYRVGRGTIARVLRRLADDDSPLVVVRPRWGVFRA